MTKQTQYLDELSNQIIGAGKFRVIRRNSVYTYFIHTRDHSPSATLRTTIDACFFVI